MKDSVPIFAELDGYLRTEAEAWEDNWKKGVSAKAHRAYKINMQVFKKLGYWEESGMVANIIPGSKNNIVLDLGCGNGVSTANLKARIAVGVDLSSDQLTKAKKSFPKKHFVVGDARKLPFKDETFDLIVAINMLHHVKNPDTVLKECFRVLKLGGKLMTVDPNLYNPVGFLGRGLFKILRLKKFFPTFPQFALGEDEYQFSKKAYYRLFKKSPFKNFTIKPHRLERLIFFGSILIPSLVNFPFYQNVLYAVSRAGEFVVKIPPLDNICYFWKGEAVK